MTLTSFIEPCLSRIWEVKWSASWEQLSTQSGFPIDWTFAISSTTGDAWSISWLFFIDSSPAWPLSRSALSVLSGRHSSIAIKLLCHMTLLMTATSSSRIISGRDLTKTTSSRLTDFGLLWAPSLFAPGWALLYSLWICSWHFFIGAHRLVAFVMMRFVTKSSNTCCPSLLCLHRSVDTFSGITALMTNLNSSSLSSVNGLAKVFIVEVRVSMAVFCLFAFEAESARWLSLAAGCSPPISWAYPTRLASSGELRKSLVRAPGTSIEWLICSTAWSATAQKGTCWFLLTTQLPLRNSPYMQMLASDCLTALHVCQIDWNHPSVVQLAVGGVVLDKCLGA